MEGYPKCIQGTSPILISLLSGETETVSQLTLGRIVTLSQFLSVENYYLNVNNKAVWYL